MPNPASPRDAIQDAIKKLIDGVLWPDDPDNADLVAKLHSLVLAQRKEATRKVFDEACEYLARRGGNLVITHLRECETAYLRRLAAEEAKQQEGRE